MAIRTHKTPLPTECQTLWREVGELLTLCDKLVSMGEQSGHDMSAQKELCQLFRERHASIGTTYYPEQYAEYVMLQPQG